MKKYFLSFLTGFLILPFLTFSQSPKRYNASDIQQMMQKLNVLANALYVGAHPDDENTRLIAYLSNKELVNTAYLSLTRGDGGQNLIGPEIREQLGVIRTQELLAARRYDGGGQFFSRAIDFGYSKSATETLQIWDREQVLHDVVWVIRNFRPDVIITRFPPDPRAGHGQHESSAILAEEAFDITADANVFPDQLKYTDTWQVNRFFLNTGRWWNKEIDTLQNVVKTDVGQFSSLMGESYTEIAALSRSQHKSQGFGATGSRGEVIEYLELRKGKAAENKIFDGIDISWSRIQGGKSIKPLVDKMLLNFNPVQPANSVDELLLIRTKISSLKDAFWKEQKIKEVDKLIQACLGLFLEAKTDQHSYTHGDSIKIQVEAVNRSNVSVSLGNIDFIELNVNESIEKVLENNQPVRLNLSMLIGPQVSISQPYWLKNEGTLGMYRVDDKNLIGKPQNDPAINALFKVIINGQELQIKTPVVYKWNDPVNGEMYRPLSITPPVFLNIEKSVYMFTNRNSKNIGVLVKSGKENLKGTVSLNLPSGWKSDPEFIEIDLAAKGQELNIDFDIIPPEGQSMAEITAVASIEGKEYNQSLLTIDYDHIPTQTLFSTAVSKAVKLNITIKGKDIGYIMGAGDKIPESLEQIGYSVWNMTDEQVTEENLKNLDAVILGVRALNTNDRMKFQMPILLDYVKNGGTLIVQYNTNFRLKTEEFAPYPLKISRDRVADEFAEIRILEAEHPVLNVPNKIIASDFDNWVQERGLYFPNDWDANYTAILSSNDLGEDPKNGGLLIAQYGSGFYVYTGYSWFRELPAGVPGAFRLFANIISLKQELKNTEQDFE